MGPWVQSTTKKENKVGKKEGRKGKEKEGTGREGKKKEKDASS